MAIPVRPAIAIAGDKSKHLFSPRVTLMSLFGDPSANGWRGEKCPVQRHCFKDFSAFHNPISHLPHLSHHRDCRLPSVYLYHLFVVASLIKFRHAYYIHYMPGSRICALIYRGPSKVAQPQTGDGCSITNYRTSAPLVDLVLTHS